MLTVTKKAAALLKAAKAAEGAADGAGIRLRMGAIPDDSDKVAIGLAICEEPDPNDEEFEQEGLRIFLEEELVETLENRILDVTDANDELKLVFR